MDNSEYRPVPGQTPLTLPKQKNDSEMSGTLPELPPQVPNPPVVKIVPNTKFVSPMPKIEETNSDIPSFLPVVVGIAAAVTIAFSVLIYLKR